MPDRIENEMFAPCGMNCMVCYVHLKNKNACGGCLPETVYKPERCQTCNIKRCAQDRHVLHCFDCTEFPCKVIRNLEKSYQTRYKVSLIENNRTARVKGLTAFMQTDRSRWLCTECGGVISLHGKECSECGKKSQV
jgi:hypothetical protein